MFLQLAWQLHTCDSPAVSRPKCIGRNHPSHLYTTFHPKGSQHASQQKLCDGIHHPALKRGRILPGWSTAAVEHGFMPMAVGGAHPIAPAKPQERSGGDETCFQIRAGDLSLLLGPVPQLSLVLQPPAPLRHPQTRRSWCSRYVCACYRQKMLYFPAASGFLMSEADGLIDGL